MRGRRASLCTSYILVLHVVIFFIDHVTSLDEKNQSPQRSYSSRHIPLTKPMAVLAKLTVSPTALSTAAISVSLRDMIGNIRRPRPHLLGRHLKAAQHAFVSLGRVVLVQEH
ncbi:hypothetical protein KCU81_g779, partial [Aureobasidium melanogenum]